MINLYINLIKKILYKTINLTIKMNIISKLIFYIKKAKINIKILMIF